ncbi:NmrA family transcriptional regulator [Streptomyces sp. Da 82-17]|uniref:NmrA family transcriptional regulator n=1 Tax=Streptomyces sp. Da 82-17 TaxID=3377116 RepID=UPI0038D411FA
MDRGATRLVLLADRGAREAERCERAVRASGAEWTVVRTGFIAQNFSEDVLTGAVRAGVVALPVGVVAEPFTDAEDIADVAAAALTEDGRHVGEVYDVTGPRLMTFAEAVAEIGAAVGRTVRYEEISRERFTATLTEQGAPPRLAEPLADLMAEVFDGRRSRLGDGVQRALGRPPRDFAAYVRAAAASGVWAPAG